MGEGYCRVRVQSERTGGIRHYVVFIVNLRDGSTSLRYKKEKVSRTRASVLDFFSIPELVPGIVPSVYYYDIDTTW